MLASRAPSAAWRPATSTADHGRRPRPGRAAALVGGAGTPRRPRAPGRPPPGRPRSTPAMSATCSGCSPAAPGSCSSRTRREFPNWDQDETAIADDYDVAGPRDVAPQLVDAGEGSSSPRLRARRRVGPHRLPQRRLGVHGRHARAVLPPRHRPPSPRRPGLTCPRPPTGTRSCSRAAGLAARRRRRRRTLVFDGRSLLARTLAPSPARPASSWSATWRRPGAVVVQEEPRFAGPAAAIGAGLAEVTSPWVLLAAATTPSPPRP